MQSWFYIISAAEQVNNIKIKEKDRKYEYQLNYVRAFHIIRNYLKEKRWKESMYSILNH